MFPIGINLCLFPLPVTLIKFSSKNKSDIFKSTSSLTLIPHPYKSSIIAIFLSPCSLDKSILEINSSISFVDRVSGSFLEVLEIQLVSMDFELYTSQKLGIQKNFLVQKLF